MSEDDSLSFITRIRALFTNDGLFEGRYELDETTLRKIGATRVEARIFPRAAAVPHILRVHDLSDGAVVAAQYWQTEARALRRISAHRHRSLPRLIDTQMVPEHELGVVVVEDTGNALVPDHPGLPSIHRDRRRALRLFVDLCEATALLHREGMIHRTLTPLSVRTGDALDTLSVDEFGMSALIRVLVRRGLGESRTPDLPEDPMICAFYAPERLRVILGEPSRQAEGFPCDVFGLGLLGALLFGIPLPDAAGIVESGRYHGEKHLAWIENVQERIQAADLPRELRSLLCQTIEHWPAGRPASAIDVFLSVLRLREGLSAQFEHAGKTLLSRPYKLRFLSETIIRLHREGLACSTTEAPDYEEYADIIVRDLENGIMVWSTQGFTPWDSSPGSGRPGDAKIVLIGRMFAYFAEYLDTSIGQPESRALQIKYLIFRSQVRSLVDAPRRRRIPTVEALFFDPRAGVRRPPSAQDPSWSDIVIDIEDEQLTQASPLVGAARWLLGRQQAELHASEYRYKRVSRSDVILQEIGNATTIEHDEDATKFIALLDREHLINAMGTCFASLYERALEDGEHLEVEVLDPGGTATGFFLRYKECVDERSIRFELFEGHESLPPEGILRPDRGRAQVVRFRQERAVEELTARTSLISHLESPRSTVLHRGQQVSTALDQFDPETRTLVTRMLDEEPLFVLQGPPGTGKTFVASAVIAEYLQREPHARILVSAQSNAALDKLLEDVVTAINARKMWDVAFVLRHASEHAVRKVSIEAKPYLLDPSISSLCKTIRSASGRQTEAGTALQALRREYLKLVKDNQLDIELRDTALRAANVVFATTAGAGAAAVADSGGFDLVVIEEAAKGWLTEILIPLVQGERWILVGDHKQLPPHAINEIERTFSRDLEGRITQAPPSLSMKPFLRYFEHLMKAPRPMRRGDVDPRHTIWIQRRMHPTIGEIISQAFYDDLLHPHPSTQRTHTVRSQWFRGRALVWIDTASLNDEAWESQPRWTNETELRVVQALFRDIGVVPDHRDGVQNVAVYSPYRKMVDALERRGRLPEGRLTATVDAVQGRQAEVVVVSLVRNNGAEGPLGGLGFLTEPERINVLMSRARRLLVLIGSLRQFSRFAIPHWQKITRYIQNSPGSILDARKLLNNTGRDRR